MAEQFDERRRSERAPVRVEATLRLLLPEETFTPFPLHGFTRDISPFGMRFETTETTEDYYRLIIRRNRYARIVTYLPGTAKELTLRSRVVWVRLNRSAAPAVCSFGLAFDELGAREEEAVRRCVALFFQETSPGVSDEGVGAERIEVELEANRLRVESAALSIEEIAAEMEIEIEKEQRGRNRPDSG